MKNKNNLVWFIIVLLVLVGLYFLTIKGKDNMKETVDITILTEGTGEVASKDDIVTVNYIGRLVDGTVFDSNTDPAFNHMQPFSFILGSGAVIPGWDEGILGMKVGEVRMIEIPASLAYGELGVEGIIPPNSDLVFEVELLSVAK